jgi:monoamine oxidase
MPTLPQETTDILESYAFKRVLKGYIRFSGQFYDDGKSFEIYPPFYGEDNGDFLFWDAAFKQGSAHNVLGVLITDKYLDDFASLSEAQILSKLLDHIDVVYGGRANASYVKHVFKDWTKEPYILGGWSVTTYDTSQYRSDLWTLLQPLGNGKVYLAGEAIPHDEWSSTIPAAALSGQTAACRAMGGTF